MFIYLCSAKILNSLDSNINFPSKDKFWKIVELLFIFEENDVETDEENEFIFKFFGC